MPPSTNETGTLEFKRFLNLAMTSFYIGKMNFYSYTDFSCACIPKNAFFVPKKNRALLTSPCVCYSYDSMIGIIRNQTEKIIQKKRKFNGVFKWNVFYSCQLFIYITILLALLLLLLLVLLCSFCVNDYFNRCKLWKIFNNHVSNL